MMLTHMHREECNVAGHCLQHLGLQTAELPGWCSEHVGHWGLSTGLPRRSSKPWCCSSQAGRKTVKIYSIGPQDHLHISAIFSLFICTQSYREAVPMAWKLSIIFLSLTLDACVHFKIKFQFQVKMHEVFLFSALSPTLASCFWNSSSEVISQGGLICHCFTGSTISVEFQ